MNVALLPWAQGPLSTSALGISGYTPASLYCVSKDSSNHCNLERRLSATQTPTCVQHTQGPQHNSHHKKKTTLTIVVFSFDRRCYCWKYPSQGFQPLRRRPNSWPCSSMLLAGMALATLDLRKAELAVGHLFVFSLENHHFNSHEAEESIT